MENRFTFETQDRYSAVCMLHATEMAATIDQIRAITRQVLKDGEPEYAMKVIEEINHLANEWWDIVN